MMSCCCEKELMISEQQSNLRPPPQTEAAVKPTGTRFSTQAPFPPPPPPAAAALCLEEAVSMGALQSVKMASYDQLAHQVEALRKENSHLRRELEDNSHHLSQLETETIGMKFSLQMDLIRQQLEFEAQQVRSVMEDRFGTNDEMVQRTQVSRSDDIIKVNETHTFKNHHHYYY
ncbi:hypothetical protein F2P81_005115 [Scophthalmus maximus]|uniref:Adenomatous polyposis coli N-terminal dimerisation domain-containing protein n=1 Tax=Scophthalmus maximus TaxID=52904 RepID=A0A6A4T6F3_SCOMX|nr:hypothetical protein F2P81_005115 [Scophthalmus maximus]